MPVPVTLIHSVSDCTCHTHHSTSACTCHTNILSVSVPVTLIRSASACTCHTNNSVSACTCQTVKFRQRRCFLTNTKCNQNQVITEPDKQCTYNITLLRFLQPLLQRKSNKYYILWVCVCSLRYPARNAHAPYSHLWPVRRYSFFQSFHELRDFRKRKKKLQKTKCVFWFSLHFLSEAFSILRRVERDMTTNLNWSSRKVRVILVIF